MCRFFEKTNRKVFLNIWAVACLFATVGCADKMGDKYADAFENRPAIDLSDLLSIYAQEQQATANEEEYNLHQALQGKDLERTEELLLPGDTAFALQLPQYAGSEQPFLAGAETFYNACLFAFNLWSNQEVWLRGCQGMPLAGEQEIQDSIRAVSPGCIREASVRQAAQTFRDSLLLVMRNSPDGWEESERLGRLIGTLSAAIEAKAYPYFSSQEAFVDSLNGMTLEMSQATQPAFDRFCKAKEEVRLGVMLESLNRCRTFDEQCSLLLNWADSKEGEPHDAWIVAVARRLMDSGRYSPALGNVWGVWRCLFQEAYAGLSRDSNIPNSLYNEVRRKCYLTCLKRIEAHPADVFAMNCAAVIGGRANLNRYGQNLFGNETMIEKYHYLPHRYEDVGTAGKTDE